MKKNLYFKLLFVFASIVLPSLSYAVGNPSIPSTKKLVYSETFDTQDDFDTWTIVDLNGGSTWRQFNGTAAYLLDQDQQGDDWLFSPAITFHQDSVYELSFDATSLTATESFKVAIGTSVSPDNIIEVLADYPTFTSDLSGKKVLKIKVASTGLYHLAFYNYSQPSMHRMEIDNVSVINVGLRQSPDRVTNFSVKADVNGAVKDTVSFKAPALAQDGTALSSISSIKIYRNTDSDVKMSFTNPTIGSSLTWTDENPTAGYNTYYIFAENGFGMGPVDSVRLFVGSDIPGKVETVTARLQTDLSVILNWNPVTSTQNNGYLDLNSLGYKIYRNDNLIETTANSTYTDFTPVVSGQEELVYKIVPFTTQGEGEATLSNNIIAGQPVTGIYFESFSNGTFHNNLNWISERNSHGLEWTASEDSEEDEISSQDNDNGMFMANLYYSSPGQEVRAISPLLDLRATGNPVLSFYVYNNQSPWYDPEWDPEENDKVKIQVSVEGGAFEDVPNADFFYMKDNNGWTKHTVMLSSYKNASFINIGFVGVADNGMSNLYVDSIYVYNGLSDDLSADSLVAPLRVDPNTTNQFKVYVTNRGSENASGYTVTLEKDNEFYASVEGTEIAPASQTFVTFDVSTSITDVVDTENHYYRAYITYNADLNDNNDTTTTVQSSVRTPEYLAVTNLNGTIENSTTVHLTWDEAQSQTEVQAGEINTVTETFESYQPFIIEAIGDWTMHDLDGDNTLYSPRMPDYPHKGEPMAYQVFNNVGIVEEDDVFESHSGSQYLIAPSADTKQSNDWLVSPLLDGREQTINFWAKAPSYESEHFIVYYSTTDKHPDSFVKLSEGAFVSAYEMWGNYSYTLPAGAKYFAIRYVSKTILLFLDDITYNAYSGAKEALTVVGYNVYKNGVKLNTEAISQNSFADNTFTDGDKYNVTVVYDKGESVFSNTFVPVINSSDNQANFDLYKVFGITKNIVVEGAEGKTITITGIDGSVLRSYKAISSSVTIPINTGMYIVSIDNRNTKVIVK